MNWNVMLAVAVFAIGAIVGAVAVAALAAENETDLDAGLSGLPEDDRSAVTAAMHLEKARQIADIRTHT